MEDLLIKLAQMKHSAEVELQKKKKELIVAEGELNH